MNEHTLENEEQYDCNKSVETIKNVCKSPVPDEITKELRKYEGSELESGMTTISKSFGEQ